MVLGFRTVRLVVTAVLVLVAVAGTAVASAASAGPEAEEAQPGDGAAAVFVGVGGLSWEDVTAEDMPTLHELAGDHAAASLTTRTIRSRTCVVDGWLTVSSGRRSTDVIDSDGDDRPDRYCRPAPSPEPDTEGGATVPGWDEYVEEQTRHAYNATLGLVGDRLAEHGTCATAVGPGAALAAADTSGHVARYHPNPAEIDTDMIERCPLTIVDIGSVPPPARAGSDAEARQEAIERRRQVAAGIDDLLGELVDELPDDTALLIAGISDSGPTAIPLHDDPSHIAGSALRVAVAMGPTPDGDAWGARWLTSASTRWSGIVQLTDAASTLLEYAEVDEPTAGTVGRPWRTGEAHPPSAEQTVADMLSTHLATQVYRTQSGPFFQLLGVVQLVVLAVAGVLWWCRRSWRPAVMRAVYGVAILIAAFPVSSYLANLAPWARFERPALALWALIVVISVSVALVALLGPWRRKIYGPAGVVSGVTATVMALDVSTGSNLQQLSLLGLSPVVAGRFFGFGNIPFAVFVAACLVTAAALAQWMFDRGRSTRLTAMVVGGIGAAATLVTGAPQAGADVGGILATIPAFTVLVIGVVGTRLTLSKLVLAGIGALAVFLLVAWLDWLRPVGARTHFGGFFDDLVTGEAWTVVWRKLQAALGTLGRLPYYAWSVPVVYAVILWFCRRSGPEAFQRALRQWPVLLYLVWAGLLAGAAGFAANDSGIIVPALLLTSAIPPVVSAIVAAQRDGDVRIEADATVPAAKAAPRE